MSKPDAKELMAAALGAKPTALRNRRPLPDAFRDASYDLVRAAEKLMRLVEDDRFPRNAEQVAQRCQRDLLQAGDLLATVVARIPTLTPKGN